MKIIRIVLSWTGTVDAENGSWMMKCYQRSGLYIIVPLAQYTPRATEAQLSDGAKLQLAEYESLSLTEDAVIDMGVKP
jgi:hypothetical protein